MELEQGKVHEQCIRMVEPVRILSEAHFPELPNYYRGKVRENYDLPDGRRIIISTDRLSAFDRILTCIPYKGQVLTQTARYWFEATKDICPNHVLDYPDPNVVIGKRLDILPVEIVVRGYLAGTTTSGCIFKGTTAPHQGANAYDVSVTFGPAPCPLPDTTVTGHAVLDGARLLVALPSPDRTDVFLFDGRK